MMQKRPTNWQVVGIGLVSGVLMTIIFRAITFWIYSGEDSWSYNFDDFLFLTVLGIVFASPWGIAGALVGRNRKNNIPSTWIGAVTAIIIGLGSFILLSYRSYLTSNLNRFNPFSPANIIFFLGNCFLFLLPGLPFGIIGTAIGKTWKQSSRAARVGGVLGAIIGILLLGWLYLWASFGFAVA